MTSLPLVLDDDEPIGIILRAGRKMLRPAKIWAYCWFTDEAEAGAGDPTHRHPPEHIDWRTGGAGPEPGPRGFRPYPPFPSSICAVRPVAGPPPPVRSSQGLVD